MTIDEAIEHARRVSINKADESLNCDNKCAREHWQLAEWLTELKATRIENARLWELANAVKEFVEDTHCEDCPCRRDCDDNNRIFCVNDFSYHAFATMRELGFAENAKLTDGGEDDQKRL